METRTERILILTKTYPSPSARYSETSCIAGINSEGQMRRIFPVPFRQLEDKKRFKKWQWIEARVAKAANDHRRESYRIFIDTLKCRELIEKKHGWAERMIWIDKIPSFKNPDELETARINSGITLAQIRPKKVLKLAIQELAERDWTKEEREKLLQQHVQGNLFAHEEEAVRDIKLLKKLPYRFDYHYQCDTPVGEKTFSHKITDWEAGMLYRNCWSRYGKNWQEPFRRKLEEDLTEKDLRLLMGTVHRFPDQWLIIGLIYPPKPQPATVGRTIPLFGDA